MNEDRKAQAITLRKEGKSYREIRLEVPVAKSTLTEWFKSAGLAQPQKQRLTELKKQGALRGAQAQRNKRLAEVADLITRGKEEIGAISDRELWLIGIALYWGEGSKQHMNSVSTGILFTNSDPKMLNLFLKWLRLLGIFEEEICFELYIHDSRKEDIEVFKEWWSRELEVPIEKLDTVYFKRDKINTRRTNVGDLYHGLLRIKVRASTTLNRKVNGWIEGIVNQ